MKILLIPTTQHTTAHKQKSILPSCSKYLIDGTKQEYFTYPCFVFNEKKYTAMRWLYFWYKLKPKTDLQFETHIAHHGYYVLTMYHICNM